MSPRAEVVLTRRAVREEWPVNNDQREKIVNRVMDIITKSEDDKLALLGINTMVKIDWLNAKREDQRIAQMPKHVVHHTQMSNEELQTTIMQRLAELGMDSSMIPANALPSLEQAVANGEIK